MLTTDEIQLFYDNAVFCFGTKFNAIMVKMNNGQRIDKEIINQLRIIGIMISSISGYDVDYANNCNTEEEIDNIIQYVAVKLGICLTDLQPVSLTMFPDGIAYMNVAFGDNVQEIG